MPFPTDYHTLAGQVPGWYDIKSTSSFLLQRIIIEMRKTERQVPMPPIAKAPNTPLIIRPVDKTSQAQARTLILTGLGEHFGFIDETLNPDLDDILTHYTRKGDIFLVGLLAGQVVCTGALVHVAASVGQVSVAKTHRRRGWARLMLQHLTTAAKERGYHKLLVQTNRDWQAAISLYQRFGFRVDKQDAAGIYMSLYLE